MSVRDSLLSLAPVASGEVLVVGETGMRREVQVCLGSLGLAGAHAERASRAIELATAMADSLDCILLDLSLADDAWGLLARLRAEPETAVVPVFVVADRPLGEAEQVRLVEAGALDHQARPLPEALFCAKVRAICERSRLQRELQSKLRFALENAALDPLTGLFNRRYFERRLREESAHARRHQRPFALVMMDLDHFKLVNDTYGHEDGDRVLRHVADLVTRGLREDDIACRYGGEELVLLLRATSGPAARVVANRLRATLAESPVELGGRPRHITFSAGVAAADERNGFAVDEIVGRADAALYRAKRAGRNRVEMEL